MYWPFSAPPRRLLEAQRGQDRGQGSSALCACSDPRRVHQDEGVAKAISLKGWGRVQFSFLFCCDSAGFPPLLWLLRRAFQCSAHSCWGPLSEETSCLAGLTFALASSLLCSWTFSPQSRSISCRIQDPLSGSGGSGGLG